MAMSSPPESGHAHRSRDSRGSQNAQGSQNARASEQSISIRLLGQFSLHLGNKTEDEANAQMRKLGRRASELLQLLSLQPRRSLPHEQVLDALWPHLDPVAGSANLRKAAHYARHFLGAADALVLRSGQVYLLPDHNNVRCDVTTFEQAADQALAAGNAMACCAAAGLYGGDLLPDAPYEPWTEVPRRRLREKFLRVLRQAGLFERLVQEEPADEAATLALMRAELGAGRRSAALRWYGQLRDQLQRLGVKPGSDAQALYRECVAGIEGAAPSFFGRTVERERVLHALRGAAVGKCRGMLVRAPAGLGKTAFCRQIARDARELGWQVRAVQASDWTRPYGLATDLVEPLLFEADEAVRQALGPHALAVLSAMTPAAGAPNMGAIDQIRAIDQTGRIEQTGHAGQTLALPLGRHQVVGALRRLLLATAQGRPVLLIVDDAHAADDSSAEALAQLAASGAPVFVMLACRLALPQVLATHSARMLRSGTIEAIDLEPLTPAESALLATRSAPVSLPPAIAADIARLAEGVPFAVVELARALRAGDAAVGTRLPRNVSAAIVDRLCDMDPGTMEAMQRLALAAEDFDVNIALALAGDAVQAAGQDTATKEATNNATTNATTNAKTNATNTLSRLDRALASAVLIVDDGRYRFRHALVRQALINGIAPHRRLALHREVAMRLTQGGAAPGLIGQHWLAAGELERALPCSLAAARAAFRLGAYEDVLRHVDPLLSYRPVEPEALALRAESMDALGRPGTLAAYDAAAAMASQQASHELKAKRALAQVKMSDPLGALAYLQNVKPSTVAGRLAEALAYSGAAALGFGDPAEGTRRAADVRRLALETGDEGTLVIASWAQAAAAHARGDLHGSVWADLKETSHLPHLAVRVFDGHLCITQRFLYGARPYSDVIAFADSLAAEARRLGAARGHAFAITLRGEAKLLSGQLDAAEVDLVAGGRLHRNIGGATGEALSLQRRAELAIYRGRLDLARGLLDDALDVARQSEVGFHLLDRIYGTHIAMARDPDAALGVLEESEAAVRGPLETCPGCRITFAIPATIAAAKMRRADLAAGYLRQSDYLANVVMKLPAWHAALHEAHAHVALAAGEMETARQDFLRAAQGYRSAGHPLDEARCSTPPT